MVDKFLYLLRHLCGKSQLVRVLLDYVRYLSKLQVLADGLGKVGVKLKKHRWQG
jgi:hypothetical protein